MIKLFEKSTYKLSAVVIVIIVLLGTITFIGTKYYKEIYMNTSNPKEIVIYSSHSNELNRGGMSAMEIGEKLAEKLDKVGIRTTYLEVPSGTLRQTAFETSKNLVKTNIKDYNKKILIDIHIDGAIFNVNQVSETNTNTKEGVYLVLGKDNPNFDDNKKFAELILKQLKENNISYVCDILSKQGAYNQDLSTKSLAIAVGTANSSIEQIDCYLNSLTATLKKVVSQ